MITESMSTDEVIKELRKDHDYVLARTNGLLAKNSKKIKSKFVKDGDVMSTSQYVVPETNDTLIIFSTKRVDTIKGKVNVCMRTSSCVKTYFGSYIMNVIDPVTGRVDGYAVFTRHFQERLKERLGKDFLTFVKEDLLKKNGAFCKILDYKEKDNSHYTCMGDAFIFFKIEDGGKKIIATTVVSDNELFMEQLVEKKESQMVNENERSTYVEILESKDKKFKHMIPRSSVRMRA